MGSSRTGRSCGVRGWPPAEIQRLPGTQELLGNDGRVILGTGSLITDGLVLLIIFTAALVRATLGFGDALLAMPLVTLMLEPSVATPLIALCSVLSAVTITITEWKHIRFGIAWRLVLGCWIGIPIGTYWLTQVDSFLVKLLLAAVVLGFATFRLRRPDLGFTPPPWSSFLFGLAAGILGGAYNTAGVVVVVYGALMRWDAGTFRATLQGFLLPSSVVLLTVHASSGLWTPHVLRLYLMCLPLLIIALITGYFLARRLQAQRFDRPLTIVLFAIGSILLLSLFLNR